MDTRECQAISNANNDQSDEKERKIYPITGEMIDEEEATMAERVQKHLDEYKKNPLGRLKSDRFQRPKNRPLLISEKQNCKIFRLQKIRKKIEKANKLSFRAFGVTIVFNLLSCIEIFLTDELSITGTIILAMTILFGSFYFITFLVLEALPKDTESNHKKSAAGNSVKKRARELKDSMRIPHGFYELIWSVSKQFVLESKERRGKEIRSYLLVLGKQFKYAEGIGHIAYSIEEQIAAFDAFLKSNLLDGERLTYRHGAFCIEADDYELNYYIEAYKKQPDKRCYMDNGVPKIEPLYNNGAACALYDLKHQFGPHSDIIEKVFKDMNHADYELLYPNAADRFAALCRKYKKIHHMV